jgi:hypothetical protein
MIESEREKANKGYAYMTRRDIQQDIEHERGS